MIVNGRARDDLIGLSIEELIKRLELKRDYLVVELDGKIIAKENYGLILKKEDRLEIVSFVGGG